MMCPFRYKRRKRKFSFGVAPSFVDYIVDKDDEAERLFNATYPTCWKKFLHWLRT